MGFRVSETIRQPRTAVWAAATDWAKAPLWMAGVENLRALDGGLVGEGTTLGFDARGRHRESTIVGWDPGEKLALRSCQGGVTADYVYRFVECPEGTRVTLDADCHGEGLGWRLAMPAIRFLMARADRGQLRALKRMIEERGATAPGSSS